MRRITAVVFLLLFLLGETVWAGGEETSFASLRHEGRYETLYAGQFAAEKFAGGYRLITVGDGNEYLVVPETAKVPSDIPDGITVICLPLSNVYLAASSAMDLIVSCGAQKQIALSGIKESDWYVEEAKSAMRSGEMLYAGKYSAPDYELIVENDCSLAIESSMIYHKPEVKEQLERLGVPVFVERSSYENHPLGRMEWIKLYGMLFGCEDEAERVFNEATASIESILAEENTGKTVAFFYISTAGTVNVRKSGDYISRAIDIAGGKYVPSGNAENDNALATVNMTPEAFYAEACDADIIIYNSTIDGELDSLEALTAKWGLISDFKAFQNGEVYCTGKNLFQETMSASGLIQDLHSVISGSGTELKYLNKLT